MMMMMMIYDGIRAELHWHLIIIIIIIYFSFVFTCIMIVLQIILYCKLNLIVLSQRHSHTEAFCSTKYR